MPDSIALALKAAVDVAASEAAISSWRAEMAVQAVAPIISQAARKQLRTFLIDGDPGMLEARFRAILDDEEAAECAGIVADLLDGDGDAR